MKPVQAYELRVGDRSLALFRSLERARITASDFVSAGREVRITTLGPRACRQSWSYDYSRADWVQTAE